MTKMAAMPKYGKKNLNIHAPVLLNLQNLLQKRDEMLNKPSILSLFLNSFNIFIKHEYSCKILYVVVIEVPVKLTW